jgi:hypothetical protein
MRLKLSSGEALYRFAPGGEPEDGGGSEAGYVPLPLEGEDHPFTVELWDESKTAVEQVLAITANGSIGYAAYYAAIREFPHRYITLRHKGGVVSRWNGPGH